MKHVNQVVKTFFPISFPMSLPNFRCCHRLWYQRMIESDILMDFFIFFLLSDIKTSEIPIWCIKHSFTLKFKPTTGISLEGIQWQGGGRYREKSLYILTDVLHIWTRFLESWPLFLQITTFASLAQFLWWKSKITMRNGRIWHSSCFSSIILGFNAETFKNRIGCTINSFTSGPTIGKLVVGT